MAAKCPLRLPNELTSGSSDAHLLPMGGPVSSNRGNFSEYRDLLGSQADAASERQLTQLSNPKTDAASAANAITIEDRLEGPGVSSPNQ